MGFYKPKVKSKQVGEVWCRYQPCSNKGVYPFLYCARPGRLIAEMERHTYSQLPVTYRTDRITQTVLLIRWVDEGRDRTCNLSVTRNSLPTELTCLYKPNDAQYRPIKRMYIKTWLMTEKNVSESRSQHIQAMECNVNKISMKP